MFETGREIERFWDMEHVLNMMETLLLHIPYLLCLLGNI